MKLYLYISFLLFLPFVLNAQHVLTYTGNHLIAGDSAVYTEINWVDAGIPGADRIWDFSAIQPSGKRPVSRISATPTRELDGLQDYNQVLNENGYEYYLSAGEQGLFEKGYVNQASKMTMVFGDPIEKMKFPFGFGDKYTDKFSGIAYYNERSRIDLAGEFAVESDASGTLVLPDRTLSNVLRIKTVRTGLQIGVCGSTVSVATKYYWYAPGYRYPVLSTSVVEVTHGANQPIITRTAYLNLTQAGTESLLSSGDPSTESSGDEVTVMMFPNPFSEKTTFNYFLRKSLRVSVELFDMTGSNRIRLVKNQQQPEGLHSGELDALKLGLTPGVYHVRFTFDKQVVVEKIVKI